MSKIPTKLTHVAIDPVFYQEIASYAKNCGFTVKRFFEHAGLYAVRHELNRVWQDEFISKKPADILPFNQGPDHV